MGSQSPAKTAPAPAVTKKVLGKGVVKRTARKPVAKRGFRGKGRGQKKVYNDAITQAAYERQRELRDIFAQVSLAAKSALEEMADRELKTLIEDPDAYKRVPEYAIIENQLDAQLDYAIKTAEREAKVRIETSTRAYHLEQERAQKCFMDTFNYLTEDIIDGAMNRASILNELHHEGQAVDLPDLTYEYKSHIPYISFTNESALDQSRKLASSSKRKAEGQPVGQPDSKTPRHTGGLLASEQQPDGVPESNVPSPTPLDEQEIGDVEPVSGPNVPDLPSGASEPDQYGIIKMNRRVKTPANRFVTRPLFEFDDIDIGYRDSTNDSTRVATRATRGKYIDTPNSNYWHWDHTVKDYDVREYDNDELDPELVEKYKVHPRYGFFLVNSVNKPEPSSERVYGARPVVVASDEGKTTHASRTVRAKKMDMMLEEDATKNKMAMLLGGFCDKEDINPDDIVTEEMRERERQVRERMAPPSYDHEASTEEDLNQSQPTGPNDSNTGGLKLLLEASEHVEEEVQMRPSQKTRSSRPYDAVRDVFTGGEPAPALPEQLPPPDTTALSILANAALEMMRHEPEVPTMHDSSMIDPRLLGPSNPHPPPPPNAFLQTALNPPATFMHIAPAPTAIMEVPQQPSGPRIPFAHQGSSNDNAFLPPLRPNRTDGIGKGPIMSQHPPPAHRPQEFGSPHALIHTNSGTYYPPAPARPYHQGLTFHEPFMPGPIQGQPINGPGVMPNMSPLPHVATYHPIMSPPMQSQPPFAVLPAQMEPPLPSVSPPGPPVMAPSPPAHTSRQRGSVSSNGNGSGKYRKIAAAPVPHNRPWQSNGGTELRLAHYDHKEAIKDYRANEPPPAGGATTIRGWNSVNNSVPKGRNRNLKKADSEEKDSPK
ncbi:hypothetical protein M426DRAFT_85158 [Hypoxylon sp. CI-4A]|nr:hypothetical protein M426DRAFT_85158 [Hypoxylon sp. CI-4A]